MALGQTHGTQFLTTVIEEAFGTPLDAASIEIDAVELVIGVADKGVEIAIAIEIAKVDRETDGCPESLAAVAEGTLGSSLQPTSVEIDPIGGAGVGDESVEIAVSIEISQSDRNAVVIAQ